MKKIILIIFIIISFGRGIVHGTVSNLSIPMVVFGDIINTNSSVSIGDTLEIYDGSGSLLKSVSLISNSSFGTNSAFDMVNKISLDEYVSELSFKLTTSTNIFNDITVEQDLGYDCNSLSVYQTNKICKYNITLGTATVIAPPVSSGGGGGGGGGGSSGSSSSSSSSSSSDSSSESNDNTDTENSNENDNSEGTKPGIPPFAKKKVKLVFKTEKYIKINKKLDTALSKLSNNLGEYSKYSKNQLNHYNLFIDVSNNIAQALQDLENAKIDNNTAEVKRIVKELKDEVQKLKKVIKDNGNIIKFENKIVGGKKIKLIKSKNNITNKVISRIDKIILSKTKSENFDLLVKYRNDINLIIDRLMGAKYNRNKDELELFKGYLFEVFDKFKSSLK